MEKGKGDILHWVEPLIMMIQTSLYSYKHQNLRLIEIKEVVHLILKECHRRVKKGGTECQEIKMAWISLRLMLLK